MKKGILYLTIILLIIPICSSQNLLNLEDQNITYIEVNGTEQIHTFNELNENHWFKFNAISGNKYVIETTNKTDINITDTVLKLYDTDKTTVIKENDDIIPSEILTSRIIWTPETSGKYYIEVYEYFGKKGGEYGLSVLRVGRLEPFLVTDTNRNISQGETFIVTTGVKCVDGYCLNVISALDPEEKGKKNKVHDEVYSQLEKKEKIPVIVKLKENTELKIENIKKEYNLINAISLELTEKEIKELKNHKDIIHIEYDQPVRINLDESIPSINADKIWPLTINNTNITGKDFSVCVLDTGIDYKHPDFNSNCQIPEEGERILKNMNCSRIPDGYNFIDNNHDPMDDQGHGSHVAGIIISEHEQYRGIAPEANIIPIKVLDSKGDGTMSDVISGIEWCIENVNEYNIVAISMSLGTIPTYADYCNFLSMSDIINEAIANNIVVLVSAGNAGATSGISAPACIENVISVGTTDNEHNFFFNRHFILDIVAPGISIISTEYNTLNHVPKGGTSMSTPHVSGAVILIQQYWNLLYNRLLNPKEIEHKLKSQGTRIYDSESGYYFPRLDIEKSVLAKGIIPTDPNAKPFYSLTPNPHNASCLERININETCNQTWIVNTTGEIGSTWEFFTIYETKYDYKLTPRFNVTIKPSIKLISPLNNTITNKKNITFICEFENLEEPTNLSLYLGHKGNWQKNSTTEITPENNIANFNIKNLSYGNYEWNCLTTQNISVNKNYTLRIKSEDEPEILSLDYFSILDINQLQIINADIWGSNNLTVYLEFNDENLTMEKITNITYSYNLTLDECGIYDFNVWVIHSNNNTDVKQGNFEIINCTKTSSTTSSSSGGGGGGGGSGRSNSLTTNPNEISLNILNIEKNQPITYMLNSKELGIESIVLETYSKLNNLNIELKVVTEPKYESPSNLNYKYFEATFTNIDEGIKQIKFRLNVEKEFITKNNLSRDDIILFRHNGEWEELDTRYIRSTDEHYVYEAISPNFSLFAIGVKEKEKIPSKIHEKTMSEEIIPITNETFEEPITELPEKEIEKPSQKTYNIIIISSLIFLFFMIFISIYKKPKPKNKYNPN